MIAGIAKKEVTLQDLLLQRKNEGMLFIGETEALTGRDQTHLVVKKTLILNIWQRSVNTLFATDAASKGTDPITVPK